MSDLRVHTFCPEHGINCKIDDDGTCSACGASAVGPALDEIERLRLDPIQYQGGSEEVKRLLARWYFSSRREGWEEGEKEGDVIRCVVDYFANTISGEWPSGWDLKTTLADIDRGRG